jgi:pilus assembly protein FimV
MSRRLSRISLVLLMLLSSEVWALGLGDIRLESALNEPLRARIELLSASPEELNNLKIGLASAQTFERYGLDRPYYLQNIQFQIVRTGKAEGNVVLVTSTTPMSEPFLTFLVEATWSRGRLLREYTVLLDPPTYAPPAETAAPPVQAPARTAPADSGRIERPAPVTEQPQPREAPTPPVSQPAATPRPAPMEQQQAQTPFGTTEGGEVLVQRHDTLWSIAQRVRPDSRLTMNQTMMAIFQANPDAFGGNINILRAGSRLRIPSADEIFRIDRGDALAEARRQNEAWRGGAAAPAPEAEAKPSLTLVPPDEGYEAETAGAAASEGQAQPEAQAGEEAETPAQPMSREDEIEQRIAEIEGEEPPQQQSLLQIRNNELAALRAELARIRGEQAPAEAEAGAGEEAPELGEIKGEEGPEVPAPEGEEAAGETPEQPAEKPAEQAPPSQIIHAEEAKPGLVDKAMELLKSYWTFIVGVLVIVAALLFWMMRRGGGEDEDADSWQPLDADEMADDLSATGGMRALEPDDESIVVVEQESKARRGDVEKTVVTPPPSFEEEAEKEETGTFGSLEDTFSSETAINLDQSDPIAEADFHMAYGLYDQAADLVNGALEVEPERPDLLTKLCEIYFVWGNRDAFIDAARRLKGVVGDGESADWDKIVIMGQQIAADDKLFAGVVGKGATKAVDLAFEEGDLTDTGKLDMELVAEADAASEFVDFGEEDSAAAGDEIDFFVDSGDETAESADTDVTREMSTDTDATREMQTDDRTSEMPSIESTLESPTIEQQIDAMSGTAELPAVDEATLGEAIEDSGQGSDHTAEINLDDLGLDIDGLAETELASLDDLDATSETEVLSDTGISEELADSSAETGRNLEVDEDATGLQETLGAEATGVNEALDDTSINRQVEDKLLDATGMTQVLSSDLAVDTTSDAGAELSDEDATLLASDHGDEDSEDVLGDDQETLLASLDDDSEDFDFAKTEALPKDTFTGSMELDETGEMPAVATTDVDLDLDDLTAALKVSESAGDTVEQVRDDATVEQPRPGRDSDDQDDVATLSLGPEDLDDDLHDARTMTEVGTKLDLARAYVDMGDPGGARSILEEVLDEGDEGQRQQAQQLLDSLPG